VVCEGTGVTFIAAGADTSTWSTGDMASILSLTPSAGVNYTLTGTGGNGCSASIMPTVVVNATPTVTASSSSSIICKGNAAVLTAIGAATYSWSNSFNSATITVSPVTIPHTPLQEKMRTAVKILLLLNRRLTIARAFRKWLTLRMQPFIPTQPAAK
jgi:hypothetical protein